MSLLESLSESFAIPGALSFDEPHPGFTRARVNTPTCTAELYLYGAHLAHWQPTGQQPVLYMSPNSAFEHGKAIRGGIPVIFPWFGARSAQIAGDAPATEEKSSQHGLARTAEWQVAFAALAGDDLHLTLTFSPTEATRAAGFTAFRAALEFVFGTTLTVRLTVANESGQPITYEEALHTYLHVSDPAHIALHGLKGTDFLDKTDHFARKQQTEEPLRLAAETDRPYLNTTSTVTIDDPGLKRRLVVAKGGSQTTVVWNPWEANSAKMADLGAGEWKHFVCVETANASENRITLAPRSAHVMETKISVEPLA